MSFIDKLGKLDFGDAIRIAGKALDVIGALTKSARPSRAADTLTAIHNVYRVANDAAERRVTPEEALTALHALQKGLEDNDDAADTALDEKFGGSQ